MVPRAAYLVATVLLTIVAGMPKICFASGSAIVGDDASIIQLPQVLADKVRAGRDVVLSLDVQVLKIPPGERISLKAALPNRVEISTILASGQLPNSATNYFFFKQPVVGQKTNVIVSTGTWTNALKPTAVAVSVARLDGTRPEKGVLVQVDVVDVF